MNRCTSIKAGLAMLAALAASSATLDAQRFAETNPEFVTWIPKVDTPPVMDGAIDQIWFAGDPQPIAFVQKGTVEDAADLSARWFGLYDETHYYFLIEVHDSALFPTLTPDNWRNDWIEVYYNMDNVKPGGDGHNGDNYQYGYSHDAGVSPTVSSNGSLAGQQVAPAVTATGYIVEVKIPFATLTSLGAVPGFSFGFDIAINDNDGLTSYDSVTYWWNSNGKAEWSNIDGAGTVGLGDPFDGNYAPVLNELPVQYAAEGTLSSFQVTATDANGSAGIEFSTVGLPSFASTLTVANPMKSTTSILVNAQPGDAGIYTFTVIASDGSKQDEMEVILIVKDPAVASQVPVFAAVEPASVAQGNLLNIDISVSDKDSLTVDIAGSDLPAFATVVDNGDKTAVLRLNPGFDVAPQTYTISLVATDPEGSSASLTVMVTVGATVRRTEFFCDPVNGNLANDGSPESPWPSLEAVFAAGKLFVAGDLIHLRDGYHGAPVIAGANAGFVTIRPATGAAPSLAGLSFAGGSAYWHVSGLSISRSFAPVYAANQVVSISGSNNVLEDCDIFSVEDSSGWTLNDWLTKAASGIGIGGSNCRVEDCTVVNVAVGISSSGNGNVVRGNLIQNFRVDGMRGLGNDNVFEYNTITDNYNVDDNHDDGFQSWSRSAIGTVGEGVVERMVLRGNVIIQTTDPDRPFQGSLQGIGCFDGMFQDWVVENNVVVVNQWHGIALLGAINCRIVNNTVLDQNMTTSPGPTWITVLPHKKHSSTTGDEQVYYRGRDNLVRNNITTSLSVSSTLAVIDNNQVVNTADFASYFVDYPLNLRLKAGSPAIDSGTNDQAPARDADGRTRPVDGNGDGSSLTDKGAYEYAPDWRGLSGIDGYYDTQNSLGWVYAAQDPWVWVMSLSGWAYIPPSWTDLSTTHNGWVWIAN